MSVTVMQWPNISKFVANIKLKLWKKQQQTVPWHVPFLPWG